jgi:hypothetical protein
MSISFHNACASCLQKLPLLLTRSTPLYKLHLQLCKAATVHAKCPHLPEGCPAGGALPKGYSIPTQMLQIGGTLPEIGVCRPSAQ